MTNNLVNNLVTLGDIINYAILVAQPDFSTTSGVLEAKFDVERGEVRYKITPGIGPQVVSIGKFWEKMGSSRYGLPGEEALMSWSLPEKE